MKHGKPVAQATVIDEPKKRSAETVDLESSPDPKKQKIDSSSESSKKQGNGTGETAATETALVVTVEKTAPAATEKEVAMATDNLIVPSSSVAARAGGASTTGIMEKILARTAPQSENILASPMAIDEVVDAAGGPPGAALSKNVRAAELCDLLKLSIQVCPILQSPRTDSAR